MTDLASLPYDILSNIFTRLPIKYLCRCNVVCKTWRQIIFEPSFIKSRFSPINPTFLLHSQSLHVEEFSSGHIYLLENQSFHSLYSSLPDSFKNLKFDIVGSCNGLVCLSNTRKLDPVCICNPITGENVFLPEIGRGGDDWKMVTGFGFDCAENTYKVLRMRYIIKKTPGMVVPLYRLEGDIHTVGSGEGWRSIGDVHYPLRPRCLQVLLNGAFHWAMNENAISMDESEPIVSFKIDEEIFVPIPMPEDFAVMRQYSMELGILEGNLCIFDHFFDAYMDIWMMMDYGVKGSWTKKFTLNVECGSARLKPVSIMENGEVFLVYDGYTGDSLVLYDPLREVFRDIIVNNGLPYHFKAISHVVTLALLKDAMEGPKR